MNTNQNRFILPAAIMGLALIAGVSIFSYSWSRAKSESQTINVTGSAKRSIVSDLGTLRLSVNVDEADQLSAYKRLKSQVPVLVSYLEGKGFPKNKITFMVININPNYYYNDAGNQTGIRSFSGSQIVEIQSPNVQLIREISLDAASLIEQGISVSIYTPEYLYTKLADIKVEVQAEAAKDAMIRGHRIAEATGRKLGVLTNARMGVLQITPENSNLTSDYGINDVSAIRKEITAVVNADFQIK